MDDVTKVVDVDSLVEKFVALRDKIKELDDAHKEKLKPYKDALEQLNNILLDYLNRSNVQRLAGKHGSVYKTRKDSCSITDMEVFWNHVVSAGSFDLVDRKANVTAVREYIEQQEKQAAANPEAGIIPAPPPGVNFSSHYIVGVRRK